MVPYNQLLTKPEAYRRAHRMIRFGLLHFADRELPDWSKQCLALAVRDLAHGLPTLAMADLSEMLAPANEISPSFRIRPELADMRLDDIGSEFACLPASIQEPG